LEGLQSLRVVGALRVGDRGEDIFIRLGVQVGRDRARGQVVWDHPFGDLGWDVLIGLLLGVGAD
jgi:hypothetical protein